MKNKLIKILFGCLITVSLCFPSCQPGERTDNNSKPQPSTSEIRGTWLWASSIETAAKRTQALQTITDANLNTVLVSLPPVTQNYGHGSQDAFMEFIMAAKRQGLSVHGWMENGSRKQTGSGPKNQGSKTRRKADNDGVDFRDPNEQEEQVQWVLDVLEQYGSYLDGIHLDYIRYYHSEPVNSDGKMDAVNQTVSKIKNAMKSHYPGKILTTSCFREVPAKEENYKESPEWPENVPQWYRDWYSKNKNTIYHGPQHVSVPMFMRYQQDPITWLSRSFVSVVMPMQYTIYDEEWKQTADIMKSFNNHMGTSPDLVVMGLGWLAPSSDTSHKGYDAAGVVRKIKYGRSIGMKGFMIFILLNHGYDDSPLIKALTVDSEINNFDAPFEKKASTWLK